MFYLLVYVFCRIWTETGKLVFNEIDPKNTELLDAATSTMRSALQKINESQTNPFQQLTLADIQPMLNGERQSPSPNVRANLINILGSLSLILVKSDLIHTGDLVKVRNLKKLSKAYPTILLYFTIFFLFSEYFGVFIKHLHVGGSSMGYRRSFGYDYGYIR